MSDARAERERLCDLFAEVGPTAPTLCAGWDAHQLAAHLWVREHRPDALPGLVVGGPLARRTEQRTDEARRRFGFHALIAQVRDGPRGVFGVPGGDDLANLHEFYVHHEDVRRANGREPRELSAGFEAALWRRLRAAAPLLLRTVGVRVALVRPDGVRAWGVWARRGPAVTLAGPVGELFLYVFGRKDAARVRLSGDSEAMERVRQARLSV